MCTYVCAFVCLCVRVMLVDNGIDSTVNIVYKLLVCLFGFLPCHTHTQDKSDNIAVNCVSLHVATLFIG